VSRFGWALFGAGSSIDPKLVVALLRPPGPSKSGHPVTPRLRDMDIHQDLMTFYGILLHLKGQSIHHLDLMRVAIFRCSARRWNGHAPYLYRKPAHPPPPKTQFTHSAQFEAMRRRRNQRLPRVRRTKSHIDVCMNESSVRPAFCQWERIIVNEFKTLTAYNAMGGPIKVSGHHHHSYCYCYYARNQPHSTSLICVSEASCLYALLSFWGPD